jgi:hypothetical protein
MRVNLDMAKWIGRIIVSFLYCDNVVKLTLLSVRWSPSMADQVFSDQATTLYLTYYLLQLLIYRPFTPFGPVSDDQRMGPVLAFPFPASIICINAAKASARILNVQIRRGLSNITNMICASCFSALVLMDVLKIDAKNKVRQISQPETTKSQSMLILESIPVCVEALELAALRWDTAHALL